VTRDEVVVGEEYLLKVREEFFPVRIDGPLKGGGWQATNLANGREIKASTEFLRPRNWDQVKAASRREIRTAADAVDWLRANVPECEIKGDFVVERDATGKVVSMLAVIKYAQRYRNKVRSRERAAAANVAKCGSETNPWRAARASWKRDGDRTLCLLGGHLQGFMTLSPGGVFLWHRPDGSRVDSPQYTDEGRARQWVREHVLSLEQQKADK
jgi:hypothetical protein